jgi:outer membrane lipoprotein-sorting protein
MKKFLLFLFLPFTFLTTFESHAQKDPKAKLVLDQMSKKFQSMKGFTANFDFTYQNEDGTSDRQSGDLSVKGNHYRVKLPDQEIFNNGKTVWTFIQTASYKEVTINDITQMEGELTPSNIYNLYNSGFGYKLLAEKQFQGKTAQVIELFAEKKNAPFQKVRLMIDKTTHDLLGWEIFDGQGGMFSYIFKNLKAQPTLSDAYFSFDTKKYPGIEIIDLR